jgi:uncharacterized membrane protein
MASADQIWTRPEEQKAQGIGLHGADPRYDRRLPSAPERVPASEALCAPVNVGRGERMVSLAAGTLLSLLGLERRDGIGLMVAGLGGAMLYRGATGRCHLYEALDVSTVREEPHGVAAVGDRSRRSLPAREGIHITQSFLINQPPEKLYEYWRQFENLPKFMTHLRSVQKIDANRWHWIADAPWIIGGEVHWEAELIADEPNNRIAWQSLPGSTIGHHGSVSFTKSPADRGTAVRVEMRYSPPGGKLAQWISKLFGDAPEQQIRDDLRNFKRLMELGEVPTIAGQPRGSCS